jgi:hypothetical protein
MNMTTMVKIGVAAIVIALAGCATQKDLVAVRGVAEQAVRDAAASKSAADSALAAAQHATTAAAAAQSTANQSLQADLANQACCNATNEKIDRMFQKAVSK